MFFGIENKLNEYIKFNYVKVLGRSDIIYVIIDNFDYYF